MAEFSFATTRENIVTGGCPAPFHSRGIPRIARIRRVALPLLSWPHPAETQLFGQLQVLNLFNQFQLCGCGGTVFQNGGAAVGSPVLVGLAHGPGVVEACCQQGKCGRGAFPPEVVDRVEHEDVGAKRCKRPEQ